MITDSTSNVSIKDILHYVKEKRINKTIDVLLRTNQHLNEVNFLYIGSKVHKLEHEKRQLIKKNLEIVEQMTKLRVTLQQAEKNNIDLNASMAP